MPVSPMPGNDDTVSFSIQSNGKEIPSDYAVISIKISQQINAVDIAEILLADGDAVEGNFKISESNIFKPGANIIIKLGYNNDNKKVFEGTATSHVLSLKTGASFLKVICKNTAVRQEMYSYNKMAAPELKVMFGDDIIEAELELDEEHASSVVTKFRGYIQFPGSAKASVNSVIEVHGFGNRFYENPFISGVEHLVSDGTWITKVQLGLRISYHTV